MEERQILYPPTFSLCYTVYNNPNAHHHAVKPLEKSKLDNLSQILFDCLSLPCLSPSKWQPFELALEELSFKLVRYIDYLKSKNDRMSEVHQSMTPIRSPQDGTSSNIRMICGNKARKPD